MEVNPNKHIAHSAHADAHGHAHGHDHHDHDHDHDDNFWSKYIFTTDHKMIAKQFLNTAIFMAFIAMFMLQEMDKLKIDNRGLEQINTVELDTLRKQSKIMGFQSDAIVNYMMRQLRLQTTAF